MESLLYLLAISVGFTVGTVFWHRKKLELSSLVALSVVGPLVVVVGYSVVLIHNRGDTEIWNGEITKKYSEHVPCTHTYSCNCRRDKNGSTTCDQCDKYEFEVDWVIENTAGSKIKIERIDEQGVDEPPRFSRAFVGEPVAQEHYFVNYLKGATDSLFNTKSSKELIDQFKSSIPAYPDEVYDYYRLHHTVVVGNVPLGAFSLNAWDQQVSLMLRSLGPRKQVNVIIVLTTVQDPNYAEALRAAWLGGKKNDVVVVIGAKDYPQVQWARVFSWTDNTAFKIQLADAIQDKATLNPVDTTALIGGWVNRDFTRKHMKDFNYLAWESTPSMSACFILAILSLLATAGCSILFLNKPRHRRYRY